MNHKTRVIAGLVALLGLAAVLTAVIIKRGASDDGDLAAAVTPSPSATAAVPSPTSEPQPTVSPTATATPSQIASTSIATPTSTSEPPTQTPTRVPAPPQTTDAFDFSRELFSASSTLSLMPAQVNAASGAATLNGVDTRAPSIPFTFDWGDGTTTDGWFLQAHTYADWSRNYLVRVTAHYGAGQTGSAATVVRFVPAAVDPVALPADTAVTIPSQPVSIGSRIAGYSPGNLTYFDAGYFSNTPRATIEYVLSVAALIQNDLVNDDLFKPGGAFRQVILRAPGFPGMYTIWYTNPVAIAGGESTFGANIAYSSLLHEMGHNLTLNSPASYFYGGKIDGNANAIFSESMAQIFQHVSAYELLNNVGSYGISGDLAFDIAQDARATMRAVRSAYERYLSGGMPFASWNAPATPDDETFGTFMTIAHQFFVHSESDGLGYRAPLTRMMRLLQDLNEDWIQRYDPAHDSQAGASFRATLMVAAISYAFCTDLRQEFRGLNFPVDDAVYVEFRAGHVC